VTAVEPKKQRKKSSRPTPGKQLLSKWSRKEKRSKDRAESKNKKKHKQKQKRKKH
jgi:hypothetical protein